MTHPFRPRLAMACGAAALALAAGCSQPLDMDLRSAMGNPFGTADAARDAVADRPRPDDRGIISYPNYQVAVARRGDTVGDVAARIGVDAAQLARFNGMTPDTRLRRDEILALPSRVAEPSPATGAAGIGPIQPPGGVDIEALAGQAIDSATPTAIETAALDPQAQTGVEPIRHKVERGETAFTIARLYDVSVRALADWNGLDRDFTVREGQYLLIPVALPDEADGTGTPANETITDPGAGSPTPTPPSAAQPLPDEAPLPAAAPTPDLPEPPALDTGAASTSTAQMAYPVQGRIIREYAKGRNEGIDIAADPGTPVRAAAAGTVAAITSDADQIPIIVIRHPDNLLTVYANAEAITVDKGDSVSRGQQLGRIRSGDASYVHFEVRKGFDSVDPMPYLE